MQHKSTQQVPGDSKQLLIVGIFSWPNKCTESAIQDLEVKYKYMKIVLTYVNSSFFGA